MQGSASNLKGTSVELRTSFEIDFFYHESSIMCQLLSVRNQCHFCCEESLNPKCPKCLSACGGLYPTARHPSLCCLASRFQQCTMKVRKELETLPALRAEVFWENSLVMEIIAVQCRVCTSSRSQVIRLMIDILHDPKDPKLWELWYIPYYG